MSEVNPRAGSGARSSAVRRILSLLAARQREALAGSSQHDVRRWKQTVSIGAVGVIGVMYGLVRVAQSLDRTGMLNWETMGLVILNDVGPFGFATALFLQVFGSDIALVPLVVLTAGILTYARRPIAAWSVVLALVFTDLAVRAGWLMWDRARPKVLFDGFAAPDFHSFPSGHTAKALAVYGILVVLWMRASGSVVERIAALLILLAIAIVVPVARLTMGVHWPSDILAGWIVAFVWLMVLTFALRYERR